MADPLSIAAGTVGLLSTGLETINTLVKFYTSYKDRNASVARTIERLEVMQDAFHTLQTTLQRRKFELDEQPLLGQIESSIQSCSGIIEELQEECKRLTESPHESSSVKNAVKIVGRRAAYPFRESTLKKLEEDVGEMRNNLALILSSLQLQDHRTIQDELAGVRSLVELLRATQVSSSIQDWLKAPDALVDHNAALAKRHPGTGTWFTEGLRFSNWITKSNSFLWLHGFAGCGKSVLCSTAIQHVFRQRRHTTTGIAFFYFTFNDEAKQRQSSMLRALLWQLTSQLSDGHSRLERLHDSYKNRLPPATALIEQLQECIQQFDEVYILVDGLDESPRGVPRENVLRSITAMRDWSMEGLHLLVTSRDELDVRESFEAGPEEEVAMKNVEIDKDIRNFISEKLSTDSKLRSKWQGFQDQIQKALASRAQGVWDVVLSTYTLMVCSARPPGIHFRWVECQFEALKRCPRSERHLERCLQSLPKSLDETYERMLLSIESFEEARRILMLLCFASRPLTILELLHGVAVNLSESAPHLDRRSLLGGADDIREICSGLIEFGLEADTYIDSKNPELTIRIAHFSVQEYLESDRIRQQKAAFFAMSSVSAHQEIATICCAYLLEPELSSGQLTPEKLDSFPFAHFAAQFWFHHYKMAQGMHEVTAQLSTLVTRMFKQQHGHFATWVKIHDVVDREGDTRVSFTRSSDSIASALYYASFLGLNYVIHEILSTGTATSNQMKELVSAKGGRYGNPLQAASFAGHHETMEILLERGADVNAQGGVYGNALHAASSEGHVEIVNMLLKKGADVNAPGGYFGNALQAASYGGLREIVEMLIARGAEVNRQSGFFNTALQVASYKGWREIVELLVQKGAEVTAKGGYFHTALEAASFGGHIEIATMLLQEGAEVNIRGGDFGGALQIASRYGEHEIVELLVKWGADVNAQGGSYDSSLVAASEGGHVEIVKLLLESPCIETAQADDLDRTALFLASRFGHWKVVQELLSDGRFDCDARDWYGSTPLFTAVVNGHFEVVELLMARGATAKIHTKLNQDLLWWAQRAGNPEVVQLIRQTGQTGAVLNDPVLTDLVIVPFNRHSVWCDACTTSLPGGRGYACKERDGFCICGDCFERGFTCREASHTLYQYNQDTRLAET